MSHYTINPPNGYRRKSHTHNTALIVRISNHLKGSCSFTLKQAPNFGSLSLYWRCHTLTRAHIHRRTQWILRHMNFLNALYSKDPRKYCLLSDIFHTSACHYWSNWLESFQPARKHLSQLQVKGLVLCSMGGEKKSSISLRVNSKLTCPKE